MKRNLASLLALWWAGAAVATAALFFPIYNDYLAVGIIGWVVVAVATRFISETTVRVAPRMTRPPAMVTIGSSRIARSSPKISDRVPISGKAIASPARWMNSR